MIDALTTVPPKEMEEALRETTAQIIDTIHSVLEKTPPELAADIADRGIVLTGILYCSFNIPV